MVARSENVRGCYTGVGFLNSVVERIEADGEGMFDETAGEAMWQITDESLATLEDSQAWAESGIGDSPGFTAHEIYGPDGKLPHWGSTWPTAKAMPSSLCDNMGGGVPIEVIDELVRASAPK